MREKRNHQITDPENGGIIHETINLESGEALVPAAATPVELLKIAVSQNADIDKLTKLMDLQERWEKNEARKAFVAAMNQFKLSPPKIIKNKNVNMGQGKPNYDYATLDNV